MRQPKNIIAAWGVVTQNGGYVGIDNDGLVAESIEAENLITEKLIFSDGSSMTTAGSGLPSAIDSGSF